MREIRTSGSEGGGSKPIDAPYPYPNLKARSKSNRGGWDKPGHDPERGQVLEPDRNPV